MAAQTVTKKRKSVADTVPTTKKAKTAAAPIPLKSALKKPKDTKVEKIAQVKKVAKVDEKKTIAKVKSLETKPKSSVQKTPASRTLSSKAPKESKKITPLIDDAEDAGADLTSDQTAALLAGFSDSEDEASDADPDQDAIPVSKIPSAPTAGLIKKRIKMAIDSQADPERTPGVIFIGRLPHGFYEHQLRAYLAQFGEILHLRVARNKKTGRSQHYAFVEFASAAVSEIVAKTMDKYLLFDHILQVRRVRPEDVKENMFAGESRKKPAPRNKLERGHLRRGLARADWEVRVDKENLKRKEKEAKLKEMGYAFDMPEVKSVSNVAVKPKEVAEIEQPSNEESGLVEVVTEIINEPEVETVRTVVAGPDGVTVEEVKTTTKKRAAKDVKNKAKKVKVTP